MTYSTSTFKAICLRMNKQISELFFKFLPNVCVMISQFLLILLLLSIITFTLKLRNVRTNVRLPNSFINSRVIPPFF